MDLFSEKLEEKRNIDQIIKSNVPEPFTLDKVEKLITDNFEKGLISEEDFEKGLEVLEKGGEGSKGGKIIGHTKSGKPIYDKPNHTEHKNFTAADHEDTTLLHVKRIYDTDLSHYQRKMSENHQITHRTLANEIKDSKDK